MERLGERDRKAMKRESERVGGGGGGRGRDSYEFMFVTLGLDVAVMFVCLCSFNASYLSSICYFLSFYV